MNENDGLRDESPLSQPDKKEIDEEGDVRGELSSSVLKRLSL